MLTCERRWTRGKKDEGESCVGHGGDQGRAFQRVELPHCDWLEPKCGEGFGEWGAETGSGCVRRKGVMTMNRAREKSSEKLEKLRWTTPGGNGNTAQSDEL